MFGIISIKKLVRATVAVSAFALVFGIISVSTVSAQGPLGTILNRMDAHYKGLSSLKSDVTMVKTDSVLNESDTFQGTTSFLPKSNKRAMYARIDWKKPVVEHIVVIGDKYQLYRPSLKQVIEGQTGKAKNNAAAGGALAFVSMSKDQLKANYFVKFIGEEQLSGGKGTVHLELTPKVKTTYKLADLWVDGDGMPLQAKITENNNDTTTVLLSNVQKNAAIQTSLFTLDYDRKKVKIIKG